MKHNDGILPVAGGVARVEVVSIERDLPEDGWWANYSCGHREFWKIAPPTSRASCPECLKLGEVHARRG